MGAEALTGVAGLRHDEPLAPHTQFGIGGAADHYVKLTDTASLPQLLRTCSDAGIPVTMLGAGSNTLVLDGGVRGLCVQLADRRLRVLDATTVELSAGYMMPRAALDLARRGLRGMEFGIGVPGSCGASVRGNAGAFGREIADVLVDCDLLRPDGTQLHVDHERCNLSYRRSALSDGDLRGHVVVAARFRVDADDPVEVRARVDEITRQRKASQPWGKRSLGSVFKNPPSDHAGRLIEACGLKGIRHGGAQIAERHANFILNLDQASAADVLALAELAHVRVLETFGVDLEREIVTLGEAR